MKQEIKTTQTDSKEGLHTQENKAEWIAEQMLSGKTRAELIMSYSNERQILLNSNKALKKIIEYIGIKANKIDEHSWDIYKEKIIAHVQDIDTIE